MVAKLYWTGWLFDTNWSQNVMNSAIWIGNVCAGTQRGCVPKTRVNYGIYSSCVALLQLMPRYCVCARFQASIAAEIWDQIFPPILCVRVLINDNNNDKICLLLLISTTIHNGVVCLLAYTHTTIPRERIFVACLVKISPSRVSNSTVRVCLCVCMKMFAQENCSIYRYLFAGETRGTCANEPNEQRKQPSLVHACGKYAGRATKRTKTIVFWKFTSFLCVM